MKITGRPPKLTPADRSRLLYQYTTGTSKSELSRLWGIAGKTVQAYIRGTHKNPGLRA
jgi:hypothetical protein